MVDTKKYVSEHRLFAFTPTENEDYEIWEEMKINERLEPYTKWFKNNSVPAKKYNFKKYVETHVDYELNGYVTVQIFDRKTDALFRLTWL